jgi:hypothetical protein
VSEPKAGEPGSRWFDSSLAKAYDHNGQDITGEVIEALNESKKSRDAHYILNNINHTLDTLFNILKDLNTGIPIVGRLTPNGNSVCLILPKTLLEAVGWHVGDTVYARVLKVDFSKTSVEAEKVPKK